MSGANRSVWLVSGRAPSRQPCSRRPAVWRHVGQIGGRARHRGELVPAAAVVVAHKRLHEVGHGVVAEDLKSLDALRAVRSAMLPSVSRN